MTIYEQQARELAKRCAKHFVWPSGTTHTKESATDTILRELNLAALLEDKARLDWLGRRLRYHWNEIYNESVNSDVRTAITNAMKEDRK